MLKQVYLFNITNPAAVMAGGVPNLSQVGPLSFIRNSRVYNVMWEADGGAVSYSEWVYYTPYTPAASQRNGAAAAPGGDDDVALTTCGIVADGGVDVGIERRRSIGGVEMGITDAAAVQGVAEDDAATALNDGLPDISTKDDNDDSQQGGGGAGRAAGGGVLTEVDDDDGGDSGSGGGGCPPTGPPLSLDDPITAVNMPLLVLYAHGYGADVAAQIGAGPLLVTRAARDVIFGYAEPVYPFLAANVPGFVESQYPGLVRNATSPSAVDAVFAPSRILTGLGSTADTFQYQLWDGMDSLACCASGPCGDQVADAPDLRPAWATPEANAVIGTAGAQFSPGVTDSSPLQLFVPQLYRAVPLEATGVRAVHKGVTTLRFALPFDAMSSAANNPANADYYMGGPDGLFNASNCEQRVPVFFSKPYFLDGNASLNADAGLSAATRPLHDSYWDVEPESGATVDRHLRLQRNVLLGAPAAPFTTPMYLPLVWTDEHGDIKDDLAAAFVRNIYNARIQEEAIMIALFISAGAMCGLGLLLLRSGRKRNRRYTVELAEANASLLMADSIVTQQTRRAFTERSVDSLDIHALRHSGGGGGAAGGSAASLGGRATPEPLSSRQGSAVWQLQGREPSWLVRSASGLTPTIVDVDNAFMGANVAAAMRAAAAHDSDTESWAPGRAGSIGGSSTNSWHGAGAADSGTTHVAPPVRGRLGLLDGWLPAGYGTAGADGARLRRNSSANKLRGGRAGGTPSPSGLSPAPYGRIN